MDAEAERFRDQYDAADIFQEETGKRESGMTLTLVLFDLIQSTVAPTIAPASSVVTVVPLCVSAELKPANV